MLPIASSFTPTAAALAAAPWLLAPLLLALRFRGTPSLDDVDGTVAHMGSSPRVSVLLPARNEAAHIADCVASLRASTWPDLEIIVVDDGSTDGTAALAANAAEGDARVRIVPAPPLPDGWFGKQWACHTGVRHATGSLLLFTDADTRHAPDLIVRAVQTRAARGAELLSVAGRQEAGTVWERAVQPLMFALILARYGGGTRLERARRASDVVANGQCFLLSRRAYEAVGGHEAVGDFVAEDVMMAQAVWLHGFRVSLATGVAQLRTRMYDGLAPLVRGWAKNVYAGGRHAARGERVGRVAYRLLLPLVPVAMLLPFVMLPAALATRDPALLRWSVLSTVGTLAVVAAVHRANRDPVSRALLAPLGAALLVAICVLAVVRGSNVRWKDRGYQAR